jgi:hypothetical protein
MEKLTKTRIIAGTVGGLVGTVFSVSLAFLTLEPPYKPNTKSELMTRTKIVNPHKYNPNPSTQLISDNPHHYKITQKGKEF